MIKYYIILLTILTSTHCFSQDFIKIDTVVNEFYYDYNFQQDSTDVSNERYQEMVLQIGSHSSKFAAVNKVITDSLLYTVKGMEAAAGFNKIWPKLQGLRIHLFCTYNVYKNYPSKKNVKFIGELGSKKTLMVDQEIDFKWKLEENKDTTILGYSCQKATCQYAGRDYTAWYSTEIPISDGPYKFHGLPGLIVHLSDANKEHVFNLYKVKNCKVFKDMIYLSESKTQETSAPKFAKAMEAYISDMYRQYGGSTSPIQYQNPEQETNVLRNLRTRNNYIEKY